MWNEGTVCCYTLYSEMLIIPVMIVCADFIVLY